MALSEKHELTSKIAHSVLYTMASSEVVAIIGSIQPSLHVNVFPKHVLGLRVSFSVARFQCPDALRNYLPMLS